MKSEQDPIADDEWLLRRVPKNRFRTNKVLFISPSAFHPRDENARDPDTDGISFYRAACLASEQEILSTVAEDRRHEFGIVRIQVATLKALDLTVQSRPDARISGHVVVPELNTKDYSASKAMWTPLLKDLADEASKDENIVLRLDRLTDFEDA